MHLTGVGGNEEMNDFLNQTKYVPPLGESVIVSGCVGIDAIIEYIAFLQFFSKFPNSSFRYVCIEKNNQHRCNGELALHVLDMIDSTIKAAQTSILQSMRTTCEQPRYFPEDKVARLMK